MIRLEDVAFAYGAAPILDGLDLEIERGEFVAFVGPSGSGKTTLLSLLSGAQRPTRGAIRRDGRTRTVFQSDGLFPWLTVRRNVALGVRELPAADRAGRVEEMLRLVGLESAAAQYPRELSGGMRQRAEIARALCGDTDILLLDEPFSALDYITRLRLRQDLARLLAETPRTVALVTHDIEEAAQLADRVFVLSERPARVRHTLRIDLPRPRDLTDPAVVSAVHEILAVLGLERATPASASVPAPAPVASSR